MKCQQSGKRRYASQQAAIGAAFSIMERGRDLGHRPLNVYECESCGDFHVGHRPIVIAKQKPPAASDSTTPPRTLCAFACRKTAIDTVLAQNGTVMPACKRHVKRFRQMGQPSAEGRPLTEKEQR